MTEKEVSKKLIAEYYCLHLDEIRAFVSKHVEYSAESEDIVQNIFLKLLQSDKMISAITLPCLIYSIARNMASDYWRHHASVTGYVHYIKSSPNIYNERVDTSSVYSAIELNELLERGMALLSDRQSNVYRMNVIGGMKVSEISETLNEKYKSVENRLGIARKEVREYVKKMWA